MLPKPPAAVNRAKKQICAKICDSPPVANMKRYAILFVVLGSILWGTDSLFRRPLTRTLSPITIVSLEHLILVILMLPLLIASKREIARLNGRDWLALIFIAVGGSVAATSLFTYSIKYGNPSVTVLLQKTQPFFTFVLARWFLGEQPGRWFWFCLPPALAGAYLVSTPDWRAGLLIDPHQPDVILSAIGAACLWGSSTVFGRYIVARLPVLVLTGLRFFIALPVLASLFWFQTDSQRQLPGDLGSATAVTAMALIPGLVALCFYYKGLQSTMATHASVGELAFPITAVTTNWLVLGIQLSASEIAGGVLLVASVTALTYLNARDSRRGAVGRQADSVESRLH
jgi:drug/metabolite transporter (DMT)-like permease